MRVRWDHEKTLAVVGLYKGEWNMRSGGQEPEASFAFVLKGLSTRKQVWARHLRVSL
jgi:hypothetical protein